MKIRDDILFKSVAAISSRWVLFSQPSCITTRISYSHDGRVYMKVVRIAYTHAKAILMMFVWYNMYVLVSRRSTDSVAPSTRE